MLHGGIGRVEAFEDADDEAPGLRGQADMDFIGIEAVNGPEPPVAPERIGDHLGFVDDGDGVMGGIVGELDGGGRMAGGFLAEGLLAGEQVAGGAVPVQGVIHFQSQEAQGAEIDAAFGLLQGLDGLIGFAAVGGADMQHKAPGHFHGPEAELLDIKGEKILPDLELLGELPGGLFLAALEGGDDLGMGKALLHLGAGPEADDFAALAGRMGNRRRREAALDDGAADAIGRLDHRDGIQLLRLSGVPGPIGVSGTAVVSGSDGVSGTARVSSH